MSDPKSTAELLAELTVATNAVQGKGWLSADLGGAGASMSLLGSSSSPLSALGGAGLGWFTPYVSFLEQPLSQLRGNPGSVSSSSQDFHGAGQDISALARSYRESTGAQTSGWSGQAASDYRGAGARSADGIEALGQASTTVASAIAGAGEVVAQAVEAVTQLITEALGKIIPIMSKAVAEAPATFGQSIAVAIPECVAIAVEYGQKILAKLAALLASGQNLLKLVQGALAVVNLVKQALAQTGQQSTKGGGAADQQQANGAGTQQAGDKQVEAPAVNGSGSDAPAFAGSGGGVPYDSTSPSNLLPHNNFASAASTPGYSAGVPTRAAAVGDHPMGGGAAGFGPGPVTGMSGGAGPGTRSGVGRGPGLDLTKEAATGRSGSPGRGGAGPLGAPMGAGRAGGEQDKEHQRRYSIIEQHDEEVVVAPAVISGPVWDTGKG